MDLTEDQLCRLKPVHITRLPVQLSLKLFAPTSYFKIVPLLRFEEHPSSSIQSAWNLSLLWSLVKSGHVPGYVQPTRKCSLLEFLYIPNILTERLPCPGNASLHSVQRIRPF